MTDAKNECAGGLSDSNAGLGVAVMVDGKVVAWFADWDEAASEWCTENHFGRWLAWRATTPEIIPATSDEIENAWRLADDLAALFETLPEMPNTELRGEGKP